jgi:hypothetical protein
MSEASKEKYVNDISANALWSGSTFTYGIAQKSIPQVGLHHYGP